MYNVLDNGFYISYALTKQLHKAYAIETDYGNIPLDAELKLAIDKAIRPILEKRLEKINASASTLPLRG